MYLIFECQYEAEKTKGGIPHIGDHNRDKRIFPWVVLQLDY